MVVGKEKWPFWTIFEPFLGHFGAILISFWQFWYIFGNFSRFFASLFGAHIPAIIWSCGYPKIAIFTYFLLNFVIFCYFFRLAYQYSPLREENLGWHIKINITSWIFRKNIFSYHFNHSGAQKWLFLVI